LRQIDRQTDGDVEGQVRCPIAGSTTRQSELERYFDIRPTKNWKSTRKD
jgi:hypothetical protein